MSGREWAASSARTLARRLRRQRQYQLGLSRSQALHHRTQLLRFSIEKHWKLSDQFGMHSPSLADGLKAAELLRLPDLDDYRHALVQGNWARHAPPPRGPSRAALSPRSGIKVELLEDFRGELYLLQCQEEQATGSAQASAPQDMDRTDHKLEQESQVASEGEKSAPLPSTAPPSCETEDQEQGAPDIGSAEGASRPRRTEMSTSLPSATTPAVAYYDQSRSTMACTECTRPMSRARTSKINEYECDNCHTIMGKRQLLLLCDPCDRAICEECILATSSDDKQLMHCLNVHGFGEHLLTSPESLHYVRPAEDMQDIGARLRRLLLAPASLHAS